MPSQNASPADPERADRGPAISARGSQPAVRGVVFEIAGVLHDDSLWRRWLLRLVSRLGIVTDQTTFFQEWDATYLADVHCGRRHFGEALESFLVASGLTWGQVDEVEAASRAQREDLETGVRALPGVSKTLAGLAASGLSLLAWADAPYPATQVIELLERIGLAGPFAAVFSSFDLEVTQPSPECYRLSLERLRLPASAVAYVGHRPTHLMAAKAAGLRTVACNNQQPVIADFHLTRFEDLFTHLQLRSAAAADDRPRFAA